jgi:asparagine synthase (glutamine-hydrolysing)
MRQCQSWDESLLSPGESGPRTGAWIHSVHAEDRAQACVSGEGDWVCWIGSGPRADRDRAIVPRQQPTHSAPAGQRDDARERRGLRSDMCGIAGILGEVSADNRRALIRMTDAIAHRGPDGAGFWTSSADRDGHGCMLGHRRLAILDLSHAADQPMTDRIAQRTHTVVFNGEIYNFKDLRRDLQSRGHSFASTGDTTVLLRLMATEGPDAVRRLRGMFAFAVWDDDARRLVLARDPLGIKPLYGCRNPDPEGAWSFMFSSEVRSILASGLLWRPRLDRRALASVVWNGFVVGPATAVEGVESLNPGEVRVVASRGAVTCRERYWRMPSAGTTNETREADLGEALAESVKLHLTSDVPVGVFLSGGIDSSAVVHLAQQTSDTPVHTFTLGFEEREYDEGVFASRIARAIGTRHHEVVLTEQRFAADLDKAVDTLDQPSFDGLNSYFIAKAVRDAGIKVALVGTGGDELFGGYSSFRDLPALLRWHRRSHAVPAPLKLLGARLASALLSRAHGSSMPPQTRWAKLPAIVNAGGRLIDLYQLAYALFLPDFQRDLLLDHDPVLMRSGITKELTETLGDEIAGHSPLAAISVLEQRMFLGERLLRDSDAASMGVSIETRLPLVDSVLANVASRLTDRERYAPLGRKMLLRRVGLAGLDPALFDRPKSGFVLPFDRWIRRSLGNTMDATMRDAALARAVGLNGDAVRRLWLAFQNGARGLYWSRIWALYMLIRWCHRHRVLA